MVALRDVAQLVARMAGGHEAASSSLAVPTNQNLTSLAVSRSLCYNQAKLLWTSYCFLMTF